MSVLDFYSNHGCRDRRFSRRQWLRVGLAGAGIFATRRAQSAASQPSSPGFGRAKSVILVYASGGQSQLDTWDPKPDAPSQIRGEFDSIETAVPGIRLCQHMPLLARVADRFTIVRSVTHDDLDHGSATYLALTGQFHPRKSSNPPPQPGDYPTYGAVLKRVQPAKKFPYTAVHVNGPALVPFEPAPGQFGGFLGHEFDPLVLGDVTAEQIVLPGLTPRADVPAVRVESRRTLLESIDQSLEQMVANPEMLQMSGIYRQAFELLASPRGRAAFDLQAERPILRERYGHNRTGQACLLARRLVEAGVPWITVVATHSNRGQDKSPDDTDSYGWDTHNDIFQSLKTRLLPRFDQAFSALLEDLDQRGLLDETLVVCMGEFGRAPVVAFEAKFKGNSPGRKHWANVYSIVMAGAGVGRGRVYGASDRIGARVLESPVTPGDISATMFSALGIDPAAHYLDPTGRPLAIATGRAIAGLYT